MRLRAVLSVVALLGSACSGLDAVEQQQYDNLYRQQAVQQRPQDPLTAGLLNIICIGDIYNGEWGAFALDLLLWPISVFWSVPQGVITAENLNKRATIAYYLAGPGRGKLDPNLHHEATPAEPPPPPAGTE